VFQRVQGHAIAPVIVLDDVLRASSEIGDGSGVIAAGGSLCQLVPLTEMKRLAQLSKLQFIFNDKTLSMIQRTRMVPVIFIDDRIFSLMSDDELSAMVFHEMGHVANGDMEYIGQEVRLDFLLRMERRADEYASRQMGSTSEMDNCLCKLRYALPHILRSIGHDDHEIFREIDMMARHRLENLRDL